MPFYAVKNLTKKTVEITEPWSFAFDPSIISDKVRYEKSARQAWYQSPQTDHHFYTGFEGVNSNARVGTNNPAVRCFAFPVDLDHPYSKEELLAKIRALPYKPMWIEKSLGKGWRLIFIIEGDAGVRWPNEDRLSEAVLKSIAETLGVDNWLGFDKAFFKTTQLYCNGGVWEKFEDGQPIKLILVESTIFNTACKLAKQHKAPQYLLPRIEKMIKSKWPEWSWPGDFTEGSQGPSWWVEGSTSPKSAIVHPWGMYSFAAHAEKHHWSWDDILGPGALEKDREEMIAKAVENYYTDNKQYYRPKDDGGFEELKPDALRRALIGTHGLCSRTQKKEKQSEVDDALHRIESIHRVDYVAPFVFKKPGVIWYNGYRYLNTLNLRPLMPADGVTCWGNEGRFPFISEWFDRVFIHPVQLEHFCLWLHWAYKNAVDGTPEQGQGVFIAGGTGIGKTLCNNGILSPMFGGAEEAVRFLIREDNFGGHLFRRALWTIDDQTMTADFGSLRRFTGAFKRVVANNAQEFHLKFGTPCMVQWLGRVCCTCNLDVWSSMIIPNIEESVVDKLNFYRWIDNKPDSPDQFKLPKGFFPRREKLQAILQEELPWFASYIYHLEIPEEWEGDARFGIRSLQDEEMVANAFLNSGASHAYELIEQYMQYHHKLEESWVFEGTSVALLARIFEIPPLAQIGRGLTVDNLNRRLAQMSGLAPKVVSSHLDEFNTRIWTIDWSKRERKKNL